MKIPVESKTYKISDFDYTNSKDAGVTSGFFATYNNGQGYCIKSFKNGNLHSQEKQQRLKANNRTANWITLSSS